MILPKIVPPSPCPACGEITGSKYDRVCDRCLSPIPEEDCLTTSLPNYTSAHVLTLCGVCRSQTTIARAIQIVRAIQSQCWNPDLVTDPIQMQRFQAFYGGQSNA